MIVPTPSASTAKYWEAARVNRLVLPYCERCNKWLHPRRTDCPQVHDLTWRQALGSGILLAHAVVYHALHEALRPTTPYTLTLTRLPEGPQILTSMPGEHHNLVCDMRMRVLFDAVTPHITLPRFVPDTWKTA